MHLGIRLSKSLVRTVSGIWNRKLSVRFGIEIKLFLLFLLPILSIATIISMLSYKKAVDIITEDHTNYVMQTMDNVNRYLNTHIATVEGILDTIAVNDIIISGISNIELKSRFDIYKLKNTELLDSIYLIYSDGKGVSTSNINLEGNDNRETHIYKLAQKSRDGIFWTPPYKNASGINVITCAKVLINSQGDFDSVLAVDVNMDKYGLILNKIKFGKNGKLYLLDENNRIISFTNTYDRFFGNTQASEFDASLLRFSSSHLSGTGGNMLQHAVIGGEKVIVVRSEFHKFAWKMIGVTGENELFGSVGKIKYYTVIMLIFIIAILVMMPFLISRHFLQPVKRLAAQMDRVRAGNLDVKVDVPRKDEIGFLNDSFNEMIERIRKLIEDLMESDNAKAKYHLKVLQSQINPHFLYNTLGSIDFMVTLNRIESIRPMLIALMKLLQVSIDKVSEFVTIGEEIENLKSYIFIQKIRYPDSFDIEYNLEEGILKHKTLKLVLQPLVENAILHGIIPKGGRGRIEVGAAARNGSVVFEVTDNGVGMDREIADRLLYTGGEIHSRGFNSIGIKNIHDRIALYFGSSWGLTIESVKMAGTKVTVTFPEVLFEEVG